MCVCVCVDGYMCMNGEYVEQFREGWWCDGVTAVMVSGRISGDVRGVRETVLNP